MVVVVVYWTLTAIPGGSPHPDMDYLSEFRILLDVLIATVLCLFVGLERETHEKPAGMRTHMIVGAASCLIVAISPYLIQFMQSFTYDMTLQADPIRIIQAIVVGVSFIGAGTVLKSADDKSIHFLTTAATLLLSTGIGICVASHLYITAIGIVILTLIVNWVLGKLEHLIKK